VVVLVNFKHFFEQNITAADYHKLEIFRGNNTEILPAWAFSITSAGMVLER